MMIFKLLSGSKKTIFLGLVAIKLGFVIYAIYQFHGKSRAAQHSTYLNTENTNDILSFENFDNQTGSNVFEMINIFSIYFNHNPELIYIHCDDCSFSGIYWEKIVAFKKLWAIIRINQVPRTETIFGVKYGYVQHRSDIFRLLVLMNYGGIYLDNDVYVVNPLKKYLKYEMAVSWDSDNDGIGIQVIIAHKNARFLKTHYDSYRDNYRPDCWYCNGGFFPAKILLKHRYMVHAVKIKLGTHMLIHNLCKTYWPEWKELDTIHLLMGHRGYLDKESPIKQFDEYNIQNYNRTYGFMVREILDRIKM